MRCCHVAVYHQHSELRHAITPKQDSFEILHSTNCAAVDAVALSDKCETANELELRPHLQTRLLRGEVVLTAASGSAVSTFLTHSTQQAHHTPSKLSTAALHRLQGHELKQAPHAGPALPVHWRQVECQEQSCAAGVRHPAHRQRHTAPKVCQHRCLHAMQPLHRCSHQQVCEHLKSALLHTTNLRVCRMRVTIVKQKRSCSMQ